MKDNSENPAARNWVMDRAWYRDQNEIIHTGEGLVLACLLHVKKNSRNVKNEEELKEVLGVYGGNSGQSKGYKPRKQTKRK